MEKELRLRISNEDKQILSIQAKKLGLSLSAYCRMILKQSVSTASKEKYMSKHNNDS